MSQQNKPLRTVVEETDEIDVAAILDVLVDNRLMITMVTALFLLLGSLYALLATPIYETSVMVQVEDNPDASAAKSLLGDVSAMFDVKSSADAEIQILGSRLVVSRAVDALNLFISAAPRRFPLVGGWFARHNKGLSHPGLFGLGGYAWGSEGIDVGTFEVPGTLVGRPYRLTALDGGRYSLSGDGIDQPLTGRVGVPEQFNSSEGPISLLVIRIHGEDGVVFELTRKSRLQTVDDLRKALQVVELGKQSGVIAATLQGSDPVLLRGTLNEIGRQYVQQNADRKAAQAENSLAFLEAHEPDMKRQLETAEQRYNDYRNAHTIIDLSEESKVVLQQSADAQSRLFALRQKREDLATRFSASHPGIVAIDEQIAATRKELNGFTEEIRQMPIEQQGALRLARDVQVDTDLYIALRNNIEQLRLLKAGKIGNVRLVDSADAPELPVKPKRALVAVVAALLGLFAGVGLAYARDLLFSGVTDPRALESHTGVTVYATIPYSQYQHELAGRLSARVPDQQLLLATHRPQDPAIESLRSLRTALQFAMLEANNNVVLLTGPTPAMGKSFVSANLAVVLANAGKRVLLIDGDLRKGYLNNYFGLNRGRGLSDVIAGSLTLGAAIHRGLQPNLDFLPTGTLPPSPAELLLNSNWTALVREAAFTYDVVLLDAPPVLPVSDAGIMARAAGTIFLVARFGETRVGEIVESTKRLAQGGSTVSGLLFNGMKPRGYGYGGKYGGYRYVAYHYESAESNRRA